MERYTMSTNYPPIIIDIPYLNTIILYKIIKYT